MLSFHAAPPFLLFPKNIFDDFAVFLMHDCINPFSVVRKPFKTKADIRFRFAKKPVDFNSKPTGFLVGAR